MPHMANLPWMMGTIWTLFLILFIWSQTFFSQKITKTSKPKDYNFPTKHWQW